jgi:hypothetical protein
MKTTPRKVASLYLKKANPSAIFQLLASKNKTSFVQSVYQQFLAGRKLSDRQKEIIDDIAVKEGLMPVFSSESSINSGPTILPVLTLDKNLGKYHYGFDEAVKEMREVVKNHDLAFSSLDLEKPIWVKKYLEMREKVSYMGGSAFEWGDLKLMSFFSTDLQVLLDSDRNKADRRVALRLKDVLVQILYLLTQKRLPTIEIQHLISSLIVALDDLRYREDNNSIFLKNIAPTENDLSMYLTDLYMEYKEKLENLK